MLSSHSRTLGLSLLISFFVGCAATEREAVSLDETPIVYAGYFNPKLITVEQLGEMQSLVNQMVEPREPWFIYVRYHRRASYRAEIYFPPIDTSAKIRRGQRLYVNGYISLQAQRELSESTGSGWPVLGEYIQITESGAGWPGLPVQRAMPFTLPEGFTEDELVELIDVARETVRRVQKEQADGLQLLTRQASFYSFAGDIDRMPFQSMRQQDDGTVSVFFGWQVAPRTGWGISVGLKRDGNAKRGYVVTGIGNWIS